MTYGIEWTQNRFNGVTDSFHREGEIMSTEMKANYLFFIQTAG